MIYLSTLLISMFMTIALTPVLRGFALRKHLVDIPNHRKVHDTPVPKMGGIAMAFGILIPIIFWLPNSMFKYPLLLGTGIIAIFGMIDDIIELGYHTKFFGQLSAALVIVFWGGLRIDLIGDLLPAHISSIGAFSIPLTLFVIVGVTNAINLSDGLDGLAGGITILSFICIAYLGFCTGNISITIISLAVIGATFGFLRFNTYPATVFMGDTGSQLLGFLVITMSLSLTQGNKPFSTLLPLVLIGFPILDTLTVMTERIRHGKSPFTADKNHFHHKLMRLGLFHTEAVFVIYLIQSFLVSFAFIFRFYSEWYLLTFYLIFSGLVIIGFTKADRSGWKLKRFDFIDHAIKGRLKVIRENQYHTKITFLIIKTGLPALLLLSSLLPKNVPPFIAIASSGILFVFFIVSIIRKAWIPTLLRFILFMAIPFIVYLGDANPSAWMIYPLRLTYNISCLLIAVFVTLILKFTRRRKGFKSTPLDYLILFIALVVPNLPDAQIQSYHLGMLTTRIIVFLFSLEVLVGELRGRLKSIVALTVAMLIIVIIKGLSPL